MKKPSRMRRVKPGKASQASRARKKQLKTPRAIRLIPHRIVVKLSGELHGVRVRLFEYFLIDGIEYYRLHPFKKPSDSHVHAPLDVRAWLENVYPGKDFQLTFIRRYPKGPLPKEPKGVVYGVTHPIPRRMRQRM